MSREQMHSRIAVLMGGGPSTVYAPRAWAAYTEFAPLQRVELSAS
jgi:hypothetical protein